MGKVFLAVLLSAFIPFAADAALIPWVGGKLVYDTDRDITWVADANLCVTLGNCVNGSPQGGIEGGMLWNDANQWAADLKYLGYTDWRLPTSLDVSGGGPCFGYCSDSEMGHLYYSELGGVGGAPLFGDQGPFTNIQEIRYWSSTPFLAGTPPVLIGGWEFWFGGQQWFEAFGGTDDYLIAWAVRDGKPHGLPEPSTLALLSLGLAGLARFQQRQFQKS